MKEEKEFRFDIEDLKRLITKKTKMLIINSAEIPTGGILTKRDLEKVAAVAIENDLLVLADEIYSYRSVYDGFEHFSIASHSRYAGTYGASRRVFKNVRNDRLAVRIRSHGTSL